MRTRATQVSDKPSGRIVQIQLRTAENYDDAETLCGIEQDGQADAQKRVIAKINDRYAVSFRSFFRPKLSKATGPEEVETVSTLIQTEAGVWVSRGRGERVPKEPKAVTAEKKARYTHAEVEAMLAAANAKMVHPE